jgi:hypothetical protein
MGEAAEIISKFGKINRRRMNFLPQESQRRVV